MKEWFLFGKLWLPDRMHVHPVLASVAFARVGEVD